VQRPHTARVVKRKAHKPVRRHAKTKKAKKVVAATPAKQPPVTSRVGDAQPVAAFAPTRAAGGSGGQPVPIVFALLAFAALLLATASFVPATEFAASRALRIVAARRMYLAAAGGSLLLSAFVIVMLQSSS
jgi:hypothetical protein